MGLSDLNCTDVSPVDCVRPHVYTNTQTHTAVATGSAAVALGNNADATASGAAALGNNGKGKDRNNNHAGAIIAGRQIKPHHVYTADATGSGSLALGQNTDATGTTRQVSGQKRCNHVSNPSMREVICPRPSSTYPHSFCRFSPTHVHTYTHTASLSATALSRPPYVVWQWGSTVSP